MGNYRPASFPRRPKHSNLFTETKYQFDLLYYQYEVNSVSYLMSPGEKLAFNLVLLSLLGLLFSAVYFYLPATIELSGRRLSYYMTGSHRLDVVGVEVGKHGIELVPKIANASVPAVAFT